MQYLVLDIMKWCTKFHEDRTCSFREISENVKCDGRTNEQTEKLYTPQQKLAGYHEDRTCSFREISENVKCDGRTDERTNE